MFYLNGTLKKKWVGRAMGNETIYWDGLLQKKTISNAKIVSEKIKNTQKLVCE